MKIIQLTADDIQQNANQITSSGLHNLELSQLLDFINSILDRKYNQPLERGKYHQRQNAHQLNTNRRINTLKILLRWYRKTELELDTKDTVTIAQMARQTKLHPNTIRNILIIYNDQYRLDCKPDIAKNAMFILEKISERECL